MAKTKKASKKITVRKSIGRQVAKSRNKHFPARKAKRGSRKRAVKPIPLKVVPAIMQTLFQLERDIRKQEKFQSQLVKKFEAKLKKAELKQAKANKKLNAFQQKVEGKDIPASKLKPLQKAVDTAQTICASIETQISEVKHTLSSLHHELDIAKKTKAIIEKFDKEAPNKDNVEKFPEDKNKKAGSAMQLDEVKPKNDKETAEEGSEDNSEENEE